MLTCKNLQQRLVFDWVKLLRTCFTDVHEILDQSLQLVTSALYQA